MTAPFVFSTKVHTLDNFLRGFVDWVREQFSAGGRARGGALKRSSARSWASVGWGVVALLVGLPLLAMLVGEAAPGAAATAAAAPIMLLRAGFLVLVLVAGYWLAYRLPKALISRGWNWVHAMCLRGHELKHGLRNPVSL